MVTHNPKNNKFARQKLIKVYRYLQALNELQNPVYSDIDDQPWVMWFRDLPDHPTIQKGKLSDAMTDGDDASQAGDSFLLRVRRPELKKAPEPPAEIKIWLEDGWQSVDGRVKVKETREVVDKEGKGIVVAFEKAPDRVQLYKDWLSKREGWVITERPARQAMTIFERLYSLYANIERESERVELIFGDGILNWQRSAGNSIKHPILLQRVLLQFDPSKPEFIITDTDHATELYTALFRQIPEVNATAISRCRQDLDEGGWHPLGGDDTSAFFKRLVSQLSSRGEFIGEGTPKAERDKPRIGRNPVLFLRHRIFGFSTALETVLEDLPNREDLPPFMQNIVGIETHTESIEENTGDKDIYDFNGEDERILLSKEANHEQLQIAKTLEHSGAVLVQGPPGTGKTHTIANLIGHLLAQGKSVLVTSHTAKALKVLREQVVESLRPLCVNVLFDDTRKEMERAVEDITERLSSSNADALERKASGLEQERAGIVKQLREVRQRLESARWDEYRNIVVAGEEYRPSEAARRVNEGKERHNWIPAAVDLGEPLPLSASELTALYYSNSFVTDRDEVELTRDLPNPAELISPVEFDSLVNQRSNILSNGLDLRQDLWAGVPQNQTAESLHDILNRIKQAIEHVDNGQQWCLAAIADGREGGVHREPWENLVTLVDDVYNISSQAKETLLEYDPYVPDDCLPDHIETVIEEILAHVSKGGGFGFFSLIGKGDWKVLLERARVNQQKPSKIEHFKALKTYTKLKSARKKLTDRWQRQMTVLGGPDLKDMAGEPEYICRQYCSRIVSYLNWYNNSWSALENELKQQGFNWNKFIEEVPPNLSKYGDLLKVKEAALNKFPPVIKAQANRLVFNSIDSKLLDLRTKLEKYNSEAAAKGIVQQLLDSVTNLNFSEYKHSFGRLVELDIRLEKFKERQALLNKLEDVAPAWAMAIRNRVGVHGQGNLPGNPAEAWLWRQLNDELEVRARTSLEELQARIAMLSDQLRNITASLVEKKAWAAQVRRTNLEQRLALMGWKQIMSRLGKGTVKRAPQLMAEARKLMPVCQTAVPVWIMPLSRVVENFDLKKNSFDVVIFDEASQADAMGLLALYMGRQVIVVGDNKQVSPLAVGKFKQEDIQKLIDEHLEEIPNAVLYDGQFSIYDLAQTTFSPICLREHFRCVSPIIQFSNHLSYEGKIKPLRDASLVKRQPHTMAYRVEGASSNRKVNEKEAQTIVSLIMACIEQPEYQGASFGVISLLGEEQALKIDRMLQQFLSASEYTQRRIQCGNSAHFQGDERDVIFLSMVDTPSGNGPLTLRSEGALDMYKKRFNVAASRARDQMWVVYSLNPDTDLKPADLRYRLIQHIKDPESLMRLYEFQEKRAESEFEKLVLRRLIDAGYRVKTQWEVGAYRIDMVVEGGGKRLAVECDGDRWHPQEKLREDMARQAILERLGWRFVRIRGSQFFREAEEAMGPVFSRLERTGIKPEGFAAEKTDIDTSMWVIKEKIICRAAEIRREWEGVEE